MLLGTRYKVDTAVGNTSRKASATKVVARCRRSEWQALKDGVLLTARTGRHGQRQKEKM